MRRRLAKLVRQFEEDEDVPRTLTSRLRDLEAEEDRLTAELSKLQAPKTIGLQANYEAVYRRAVADLEADLASASGGGAREAVRSLIEKVAVQPRTARGGKRRDVKLHGDLFGMLEFTNGGNWKARKRTMPPPLS